MKRSVLWLGVSVLLLSACGSDIVGGDGGIPPGADLSGSVGPGGDGGNGQGCNGGGVTCTMPEVCSPAGNCLRPGTCLGTGDCQMGEQCVPGDGGGLVCEPGGMCGGQKIGADLVEPNLLITLDRSCSMTEKVGNMTKWQLAVAALQKLTTDFKGRIRFGLTLFPDTDNMNCDQAKIPIPVGDGNEAAIQKLLNDALTNTNAYFPDGPCVTNIDGAVHQASMEPAFKDLSRPSFVLLLTDGEQSACNLYGGANGATMIISDMRTKQMVDSFVIGFGSGVNVMQLDAFATAGGKPSNGMHKFYDATDGMSLQTALNTIASSTVGCVYKLQMVPPDPSQIFVFFDKMSVKRDPNHMDGWDYDAANNQVVFYGPPCSELKAAMVGVVDIVFGCDAPPG
jgi:hypothetical protein